ncbi:MAG TPA: thiamine phosphate synthase, partial [Thermoanaerobaculia bacterium]|nr:thiamine phosphate synthase [Thermoanaerobaculia bacterium]
MRAPAGPSGRIYAIADVEALHPAPLPAAVRDMAEAGIQWIQVRAKKLSGGELCRQVEECCRALEGSGVRLWVDDRADVAALFPVAGLHVGQTDLPPAAARRVVGDEMWIGFSTHDEEQLLAADADPEVDVIAVGPVFPTTG